MIKVSKIRGYVFYMVPLLLVMHHCLINTFIATPIYQFCDQGMLVKEEVTNAWKLFLEQFNKFGRKQCIKRHRTVVGMFLEVGLPKSV